jgi:hypothetical protein
MDWRQAWRWPTHDHSIKGWRIGRMGEVSRHIIPSYVYLTRSLRWYTKHPLHLSSSPPRPTSPSSEKSVVPIPSHSLSDSVQTLPSSAPHSSFTTALAMLLYNVCFLAYTQDVMIPLAGAGDILGNLWAVCCSSELGRCVSPDGLKN